ncbi:MAG: penicillin-binding protein 2 [Minisyncoccia bacterium]
MRESKNRLRLISLFIILFAFFLIGKLYLIQVVSKELYLEAAESQYIDANRFDRGSIFFTTKEGDLVPVASIKSGYILFINPNNLLGKDLEKVYESLSAIVTLDKDDFLTKAKKVGDPYEEVARRLSAGTAERIRALKIGGVGVASERWRIYPGELSAAHTIGLIGYSGDTLGGRYGLELFYEEVLGRDKENLFVNFFAEIFSNIKKAVSVEESPEGDIVSTIEPSVQTYLEGELKKVMETYSSDFTGGVVIDPMTGEIFAMALTPSFNPGLPQNEESAAIFRNRLVEDRYEMGSILKAITLAIGLDTGAVTAKNVYYDPGCMTLNTRTFCNYDGKSHGSAVTMQTVLSKSLNTGAAHVVSKVGSEKFSELMLGFGFEGTTGIDLPNEGKSLVSNLKSGRDLEAAQASFGQGIALTPIMTVRALSALANGGTLITPHLVKEIRYKLGPVKTISYPPVEKRVRVLKPETSAEISRMLTEVVDRTLRNGEVRLDQYSVAAKTGTAQVAKPGGGGYYDDVFLHSFFGYFPAYDPKFLVFLYTYRPKGVRFASETLTDAFINTAKFLINYYDIVPDREAPPPARP